MTSLFNLIWFVFGGAILSLLFLMIGAIWYITYIGRPIGFACFEFAKLCAWPFGKDLVREKDMNPEMTEIMQKYHLILNLFWFPAGLCFSLIFFMYAIFSFVTIIGIPNGIVLVKMGKFVIFPVGLRVVSAKRAIAIETVNEMKRQRIMEK